VTFDKLLEPLVEKKKIQASDKSAFISAMRSTTLSDFREFEQDTVKELVFHPSIHYEELTAAAHIFAAIKSQLEAKGIGSYTILY
jgi:hypothetical protein